MSFAYMIFRVRFDPSRIPPGVKHHTVTMHGPFLLFLGEKTNDPASIARQALKVLDRPTISTASWYRDETGYDAALAALRRCISGVEADDQTANLVTVSSR